GSGGIATIDLGGTDIASGVSLTPDGRIVVAGSSDDGADIDFAVARFDGHGDPDDSFSGDGRETAPLPDNQLATALAGQDDGAIVVVGEDNGAGFLIARFNRDGGLDNSFSGDGVQTTTFTGLSGADAVTVQPDGKLVVGGGSATSASKFELARYLPGGTL